ncbi:MAG: hypothetical protein AAFZ17_01420 [Cyanobacteria bacterium J06650_10]
MNIAGVVANVSLFALLGWAPSPERVASALPYIQASAFAVMAANNGLQIAKNLKSEDS